MMQTLDIVATALDAGQKELDLISNNLANVSNHGFKKQRAIFEDLLYQVVNQPGSLSSQQTQLSSGLTLGVGVRVIATEHIFTQGGLERTDNPLDVAINGKGFFQIQMPDGTLAYSRNGAFQRDSSGQIVTPAGFPLSPSITIPEDAISITISRDGIVSATQAGQATPTQLGNILLATFVNEGGLQSVGENLFIETASSGAPTQTTPGGNGAGLLNQGMLEGSNVNVAESLVDMIKTQRAYELNTRVVTTSDNMLARLTQM